MQLKKVFIASPTVSGIVTTAYAGTLMAVTMGLQKRNVTYRYTNFDGSDIVMARNYLANAFLQDETASHILYVDSDMAVPQDTLSVLFDSDKEFDRQQISRLYRVARVVSHVATNGRVVIEADVPRRFIERLTTPADGRD